MDLKRLQFIFLFPGIWLKSGGILARKRFCELAASFTLTGIVIYEERTPGLRYLGDVLANGDFEKCIFVIHWGTSIRKLCQRLAGLKTIYFSHSPGWKFELARNVPVVCVSRNTMGYWGCRLPYAFIPHVPNLVPVPTRTTPWQDRDIDVLGQKRKTSLYMLTALLPRLKPNCNVVLINHWVDDITV